MKSCWTRVALTVAAALAVLPAAADVTINVNAKEGEKIAGEHTFVVTVQADSLVTSVEFYVGEDLRDTDESTPYEFKIDSLNEEQGPKKITFAAYTQDGQSAKKTVNVTFDNGIDLGIDHHIDAGQAAFSNGDWDTAIQHGRVALKISPTDNRARMLMSRANLGAGVLDLAQKFAEDVVAAEPENRPALDLLSAIHLRRAFRTMAGASDRALMLETTRSAFAAAADARRRSLEIAVDTFGTVTDANRLEYCDLLSRSGRYSLVINQLYQRFRTDPKDPAVANRVIYAQIRAGRYKDAAQAMQYLERFGAPDGYSYALKSILVLYAGDVQGALDAEKEAILNDPASLGVRTAQAYLALRRGDLKTLGQLTEEMGRDEGQDPVVNSALMALRFATGDYTGSGRAFETAVLAEPSSYETFVERAHQAMTLTVQTGVDAEEQKYQRDVALAYFEAALAAKPDSFEALTGKAVALLMAGKNQEAAASARAAAGAGPEYAAAHYALAAALFAVRDNEGANAALKTAETLDPKGLRGRPVPNAVTAWRYAFVSGRAPLVSPPGR